MLRSLAEIGVECGEDLLGFRARGVVRVDVDPADYTIGVDDNRGWHRDAGGPDANHDYRRRRSCNPLDRRPPGLHHALGTRADPRRTRHLFPPMTAAFEQRVALVTVA